MPDFKIELSHAYTFERYYIFGTMSSYLWIKGNLYFTYLILNYFKMLSDR